MPPTVTDDESVITPEPSVERDTRSNLRDDPYWGHPLESYLTLGQMDIARIERD